MLSIYFANTIQDICYAIVQERNECSDPRESLTLFNNSHLDAFLISNSPDHSDTDVTDLREIRLKDTYVLQNLYHSLSYTNSSILESYIGILLKKKYQLNDYSMWDTFLSLSTGGKDHAFVWLLS